jgi:hypothetical protein
MSSTPDVQQQQEARFTCSWRRWRSPASARSTTPRAGLHALRHRPHRHRVRHRRRPRDRQHVRRRDGPPTFAREIHVGHLRDVRPRCAAGHLARPAAHDARRAVAGRPAVRARGRGLRQRLAVDVRGRRDPRARRHPPALRAARVAALARRAGAPRRGPQGRRRHGEGGRQARAAARAGRRCAGRGERPAEPSAVPRAVHERRVPAADPAARDHVVHRLRDGLRRLGGVHVDADRRSATSRRRRASSSPSARSGSSRAASSRRCGPRSSTASCGCPSRRRSRSSAA